MAATIDTILRCANFACDGIALVKAYRKNLGRNDVLSKGIRATSLIARTALLCSGIAEIAMRSKGASNWHLRQLKTAETMVRVAEMPVRVIETVKEARRENSQTVCITKTIEGITAAVASTLSSSMQAGIYEERHYLKQPSGSTRPIIDREGMPVGKKPIDKQECQDNIKALTVATRVTSTARVIGEVALASSSLKIGKRIFDYLKNLWNNGRGRIHPDWPLRRLRAIPDILHNDEVFRRHICPITMCPIRHPVMDPNGVAIYEKSAIERWIRLHGTSPMTRAPLTRAQLIPRPNLLVTITNRLREYEEGLWNYLGDDELEQRLRR